jgi:secreted PhoX family phosphatase
MGHIIRWKEDGDFDGTGFQWNHLVLAGDPANERAEAKGNIKGDIFGCPDGMWVRPAGVLWIQTDVHATQMYKGEFKNIGNNQMLACDPRTGEIAASWWAPPTARSPAPPSRPTAAPCSSTSSTRAKRPRAQRPGEPRPYSNWPDYRPDGRPRSATVVIRKATAA